MASYKIISVDNTGAVVDITFDNARFESYGKKKQTIEIANQQFKFDGLRQDTQENFIADVEARVAEKVAEIDRQTPPQDILDLVGSEKDVASGNIELDTPGSE